MATSPESNLKLEIAHVLLIDVVGYSKLLVNEQIELLEILNKIVRETRRFRAAEAAGKLTRLPTGDGMALIFSDSAEAPVECALEIAQAVKEHPLLQLRMGAHSGAIKEIKDVNDRPNFAGAGLNIAQRVLDCGDAGHILLSRRLGEDLMGYRHWQPYLTHLGECEVKHGIKVQLINLCKGDLGNPRPPEKVRLQQARLRRWKSSAKEWTGQSRRRRLGVAASCLFVAAALAALLWLALRPAAGEGIAVLPFGNLSEDQTNRIFVDGVQDEILTSLSKVSGLKVISRPSVMPYAANTKRNLRKIADDLGVSHLLEGNVQRDGQRVRVYAQLIDARTNSNVWADRFDGELADVFAIQSQIAERIVAQLRIRLSPQEKAAIGQAPTRDLAAYDLYARAKKLVDGATISAQAKEDLTEAVILLEEAIKRDPLFLFAAYQLAHAQDQLYLRFDRTPARLAAATAAVQAVQRIAPDSGEARLALAKHLYWAENNYTRAREEAARAARDLPNDPYPALLTGYMDRREGRWEESTRHLLRALELDPQNPIILAQIALTYFNQRRFTEMATVLDRAVQLVPDDIALKARRAAVDYDWRGDTKPLRAVVQSVVNDPGVVQRIADFRMDLALLERDQAAMAAALASLPEDGCSVATLPFPTSWCDGLAARMRHDEEAARTAFGATRFAAEQILRDQPQNAGAWCVLGMANAALGRKSEAIEAGSRAVELLPVEKDALTGAYLVGYLAIIYAWTGETDRAFAELERATTLPSYWSYGSLLLHPYWDPLRGDPRFQAILARLAPREPGA